MEHYHNFIGIDMGKSEFVVAVNEQPTTQTFSNDAKGMKEFLKAHKPFLKDGLCVVETTGGYELDLVYTLSDKGFRVHRAHGLQVKNFVRSFGKTAKTDALDAKALVRYGKERHVSLNLFQKPSEEARELTQLVRRRKELVAMCAAEKNRLKAPQNTVFVLRSIRKSIKGLSSGISEIDLCIKALIDKDPLLKEKRKILMGIPGIGAVIAAEILALLPELGHLSRRQIASLVGVAPQANDSGKYQGYRRTGRGRDGMKATLFIAAMAARNSHSPMKSFYEKLEKKGKVKMVCLVALMRKIIVIANAKLRDFMEGREGQMENI